MTVTLEVENVSKSFGKLKAVDDVSFSIPPGTVYGFIGPNGAGKTTTMRICSTLSLPDEGDVRVEGYSVLTQPREVRHRLGFMPDQFGAYSSTTVHDYLDFFARAYGLKGKRRRAVLREVSEFTALDPLLDKLTGALSKGMRQRLCLAKTLLHDPSILILDEPASGLDPRARVELRELLRALAEMGKSVLISSHILTELSEVCDGVAIIEAGKIQATGAVTDIIKGIKPHAEIFLRLLGDPETAERMLLEQPGVGEIRPATGGVVFHFEGEPADQAKLLEIIVERGLQPIEFASQETDLEDLFLHLTEGKVQ